jgi:hypothetical protein
MTRVASLVLLVAGVVVAATTEVPNGRQLLACVLLGAGVAIAIQGLIGEVRHG